MWLYTVNGFYSAVQDQNDAERIMVRARKREDLEAMLEVLELQDVRILEWSGSDYAFRCFIRRLEWAQFVLSEIMAMHYVNYKDAALDPDNDKERSNAYHSVWGVMRRWQDSGRSMSWMNEVEQAWAEVDGRSIFPDYDMTDDPDAWLKNYWIK